MQKIQATVVVPCYFSYQGDLQDDVQQKTIRAQIEGAKNLEDLHRLGWKIDTQRFAESMEVANVDVGLTFEEAPAATG